MQSYISRLLVRYGFSSSQIARFESFVSGLGDYKPELVLDWDAVGVRFSSFNKDALIFYPPIGDDFSFDYTYQFHGDCDERRYRFSSSSMEDSVREACRLLSVFYDSGSIQEM